MGQAKRRGTYEERKVKGEATLNEAMERISKQYAAAISPEQLKLMNNHKVIHEAAIALGKKKG